jgi:glycine cleavage system H protein
MKWQSTDMAENPDDRLYSTQHQWVKHHEGDVYTLGLSWYAHQGLVGPELVELPEVGEHLESGEMYGIVECLVGALRELFAPVAGQVVEINEEIVEDPELIYIYDDPYEEYWLIRIRPDDPVDRAGLLDAEEYTRMTPYAKEWGFGGLE